jgi:AcrR family transcriptional regulator
VFFFAYKVNFKSKILVCDSITITFTSVVQMLGLQVNIKVSEELYLRNPDSSELGKRIISGSIDLINDLGFELFTFKKLGERIGSPESSIYRYFESKQSLLIYLVAWYWSWVDYKLAFATTNIDCPKERLKRAIDVLVQPVLVDYSILHVNEVLLSEIIITESVKAYHTREVDDHNKKGCFRKYKEVVQRVSNIVLEVNPTFEYPHMMISTIIEGTHQQRYFKDHLPALTDVKQDHDAIGDFYSQLVFKMLG